MGMYSFTAAFRFDEKYPVKAKYLHEPGFGSGVLLKHGFISRLEMSIGEEATRRPFLNPVELTSGVIVFANKLRPKGAASIYVTVDKTYDRARGDVFPTSIAKCLRANSYYIEYQHKPLGIFAPIAITKRAYYDFDGKETKADNYKTYKQKCKTFLGIKTVELKVTPDDCK